MPGWALPPHPKPTTRDAVETLLVALTSGLFFGMACWTILHAYT